MNIKPITRRMRPCAARCAVLAAAVWGCLCATAEAQSPIRDDDHRFQKYVWNWQALKEQNVVLQRYDYSCGAAALSTVLKYFWNDPIGEREILKEIVAMLDAVELQDRVQNGLTMTDLRRVAVRLDYEAAIGTLEYDKLQESKVPLIVGISPEGFDHFVVYRGTDGYYVYLADPVRGNIRIPGWEFAQQWQKNMVLAVAKPGDVDPPEFTPLTVTADEWFLGRMNEQAVRRHLTRRPRPLPFSVVPP